MSNKTNYFVWSLDDEFSTDVFESNFDSYAELDAFKKISVDDILIGFNENSNTFNYLFIVKEKNGNIITLEKRLNNPIAEMVLDNSTEEMLEDAKLIEIEEEKFK